MTREEAMNLLKKYNSEEYHLYHAETVGGVLRWFAEQHGYGDQADFWENVGILHDIDFEQWPEEHCIKAQSLLAEEGVDPATIHAVVSHGYGITVDVAPEHEMEKILFASDELTGIINAAAKMRPSKSCKDMDLKSLKKKFKSKAFAAGCSREVITQGAEMLGWELDTLLSETLAAMQSLPNQ